ncbi:enoyl-CoA hydratase/isomerase family protein [Rhodococcus sp. 14C212]|uniref:enoyl-CoA hydratase/isomerase family protein n=1 Tax=Rhodococcus TaxID=1827 RepID=UPI00092B3F34|nr:MULTISPECIES: enoyl-CoA hydratase/isomerase family protein [unclassified Rhodococcus (in: high G+C Gram-positive bacteria)]NGP05861.1 enoyl-CoA hydratase/isomerase family protein [Rhodococcus sp. 14C212]OLL19232.1 enoyl-CoA hydratase [Rhodococcus sp. M8]OOL33464.1 enoyl-CoA hydratase [Rhodococcus rhodochrous]QPG47921.1 enoyl-CoA hydratase/isomerase family protein [Rhodococcus sp. M8]
MTKYKTIEVAEDAGVAEIILSRPERLNAIDEDVRPELIDALTDLGFTKGIRAVVLGARGKVFSAGGDFEMMKRRNGDPVGAERGSLDGRQLLRTIFEVPVPVIAALQGHAVGLGSTIALSCDVVVASKGVRIMDSHVKIGLVAGDGGAVVWPPSVGLIRTKRHLLFGDPVLAEDGYAMGMVSDLVETPDEVLPLARDLARRLAELPPLAVQGTKRTLNAALAQQSTGVLDLGLMLELGTMQSEDLLEAIDAFENKRKGHYTGA